MKVLLLIFLICINYAISKEEWNKKKSFPKKVNPDVDRSLHLRRYIINKPVEITKKRNTNLKDYTFFPSSAKRDGQAVGIPESPYFQVDENYKVDKELYESGFKRKRSVDGSEHNVENVVSRRKRAVAQKLNPLRNLRRSGKSKKSKPKQKQSNRSKPKKIVKKKTNVVKRRVDNRRLIAAKDALIEEYPYTVSVQKGNIHWCSGALLNQRMVITTANCVWKGSRMSRLKVRAGSRHVDRGGQVAKIQEMMRHPRWSIRGYPDYDVALLLLDRTIRFSHSVHGVDLPNRIMLPPFNDAWVTSFGSNRRDGLYPETDMTLQVYYAQLMDREKCSNITKRFGITVTPNFFCLAQTGRRAPCTRDTGAPAVSDGVVWGLASWGIRKLCGTERYPAVYSYLGSHGNMEFITNATKVLMSEERHYPFLDRFQMRTVNRSQRFTTLEYYTGQH